MQIVLAHVSPYSQQDAGPTEGDSPPVPATTDESIVLIQQTLFDMWESSLTRLPLIVAGIAVIFATWGIAVLVDRVSGGLLKRSRLRSSLRDLIQQVLYVTIWVGGLTVAAIIIFPGMTPTKVLTALGLGSIAIGFAFKDIVENFFAGILILWRFPFDPGDFIECAGIEGKVESTTIRMTTIRQVDGQLVVVPNAMLFKNPVNVLTSLASRRITVICGVAYGEDVDEAREVIRKAVESCETISKNRPVHIFAQEFADSSINFEVTWWAGSTPEEIRESRDEIVAAVKRALDDANIEIPFPYRMLTFKEPLHAQLEDMPSSEKASNSNSSPAKAN